MLIRFLFSFSCAMFSFCPIFRYFALQESFVKKQSQTSKKSKFLWKFVHMASNMAAAKEGTMTCKPSTSGNCHVSMIFPCCTHGGRLGGDGGRHLCWHDPTKGSWRTFLSLASFLELL